MGNELICWVVQLVVAGAAALGVTINHSTFVCTRVNDAMMTTVAGNLKNVVSSCFTAHPHGWVIGAWPQIATLWR